VFRQKRQDSEPLLVNWHSDTCGQLITDQDTEYSGENRRQVKELVWQRRTTRGCEREPRSQNNMTQHARSNHKKRVSGNYNF